MKYIVLNGEENVVETFNELEEAKKYLQDSLNYFTVANWTVYKKVLSVVPAKVELEFEE